MAFIRFIYWSFFHYMLQVTQFVHQVWNSCASLKYNVLDKSSPSWASERCWLLGEVWSIHIGRTRFKYLEGLLKEVTASYTYTNRDITLIKKKVCSFVYHNTVLFFSLSILDSLHYFDKIYKDIFTMEYHFGFNN